ncbi:MAG TPA: hypothetical protein VGO62_15475, partial [Myxococcota bacterium]
MLRVALLVVAGLGSACAPGTFGRQGCTESVNACYSAAQRKAFREADFPVLARGHSYLGRSKIVGECTVQLPIGVAYPGISEDATFQSIIAEQVTDVTWQSPGAPDPARVFFLDGFPPGPPGSPHHLSDFGFHIGDDPGGASSCADDFVNAFDYSGATAPALDAEITCAGVRMTTANALVLTDWFAREFYTMPALYGLTEDELLAALDDASHGATPIALP